jgi:hypothetical protein
VASSKTPRIFSPSARPTKAIGMSTVAGSINMLISVSQRPPPAPKSLLMITPIS